MGIFTRISRDIELIGGLQRTLKVYGNISADTDISAGDELERTADRVPQNEAIRFEGRSLTYEGLDHLANRFAHWALAQGMVKGDIVALFMTNRPEFLACWLGLSKIGVITGLINTNLTGQPLIHTITISAAKHVIVSSDLAQPYQAIAGQLTTAPKAWSHGGVFDGAADLDAALAEASPQRPPRPAIKGGDVALYVYTSGTTGAPKAAKMPHWRVIGMMRAFVGGGRGVSTDKVYVTLPLYHSTGGLCGTGFAITTGATIILRRKFSATHFWEEATNEGATVFFYIGELCRYLLNQPPHGKETAHKIRLAVGNGMRPDVWDRFQTRFKIPKVLEFYGSTEGNVSMINFDGRVGAIGRIPGFLKKRLNVRVVKFDLEAESPIRTADGLCIEAAVDEVGEALGEIRMDEVRFRFEGYSGDQKQTEKKILRDVFQKGDAWFRTGDLMRVDKDGYFFFIDRIGDTFRWKGENVSTNEVGDVLATYEGINEANVYGVQVGGLDGRAGMAAISMEDSVDLTALRAYVERNLAAYARPLFLRIQPQTDITGTFKYRKVELVREGFDPTKTNDKLYFDNPETKRYEPITEALFADIQAGKFKL